AADRRRAQHSRALCDGVLRRGFPKLIECRAPASAIEHRILRARQKGRHLIAPRGLEWFISSRAGADGDALKVNLRDEAEEAVVLHIGEGQVNELSIAE